MNNQDIRWQQRFKNYQKALRQLEKFLKVAQLNEMEEQGLIQAFEYTYELAWNVIKDYLAFQGITDVIGSRDAFRIAFNRGLIVEGEVWMSMIESRIKSAHTYNEEIVKEILKEIREKYFAQFILLETKLKSL
ncbi:MAG: nucleotidyltransferase substrate binding protein [Sphingobacteriales bacterium]|nr:nucleotidyltransferase substrate binding protein [Sphingobacteriales bacterium]